MRVKDLIKLLEEYGEDPEVYIMDCEFCEYTELPPESLTVTTIYHIESPDPFWDRWVSEDMVGSICNLYGYNKEDLPRKRVFAIE